MKKKNISLVAILLSSILAFTACDSSSGDNTDADDASANDESKQNEIADAPEERPEDEIVIWSSVTGPDGELVQENIDEYNETNPDYPVALYSMEAETLQTRLVTATRSGTAVPDLALVAAETVNQYANQNLLEAWDEYIEGTEVNADNYVAEAWDVGTVNGEQYGIPVTLGSWVMYYNKDLVDQYMPGALDDNIITFAEIEEGAEAAVADGIVPYGFGWPFQNFNNLYLQMGGSFADADGKIDIHNDTAIKTAEYFKHLYDEGYTQENGEDTVAMFMNGEIMILPEGTWMLSQMEEIEDFEWGETFIPQWDENNIVQCTGVDQFVRFVDENRPAERVEAAVEFMDWLRGNSYTWIQSGANPASLAMLEDEDYLDMPQSFLIETQEGRDSLEVITDEGSSIVFSALDDSLWDMILGNVDIDQKFAEIQQEVNDTLAY